MVALDVGRLRVLVEVAHAGSVAAAARRMRFTPSALSQQLAKLEAEVGQRLLDRGPRGVRLTAAGQVLVEHGERVLGELREAEAALSAVRTAPRTIAIGTFATGGTVLVPPALARLRQDHPDVLLSLRDLEPPDGYGLVASGDLDLLITHRYPGMPSTPLRGLVRRTVLVDPLRLVVPAGRGPSGWAAAVAEPGDVPWVSGAPGVPNRVCLELLGHELGFRPRVDFETADYALTLALVRAGLGIALVPGSVLAATGPGGAGSGGAAGVAGVAGVAVQDLPGARPAREVCVVHRRRPSATVRQLVELIARAARAVG